MIKNLIKIGEFIMLTSKQRAYLKSLSSKMETILIVGKDGVSKETIKQAEDALVKRELIKGKILETTEDSVKDVANIIAEETNSEVVQVIGNKFILYKKNEKEPKITLPKAKKR